MKNMVFLWALLAWLWGAAPAWAADNLPASGAEYAPETLPHKDAATQNQTPDFYAESLDLYLNLQAQSAQKQQQLWRSLPANLPEIDAENHAQVLEILRFFMIKALFSPQAKSKIDDEISRVFAPILAKYQTADFPADKNIALQKSLRFIMTLDKTRRTQRDHLQQCQKQRQHYRRKSRVLANQLERLQAIENKLNEDKNP